MTKIATSDAAAMLGDNQAFKMAASGGVADVNIQYSDYFAGLEGPAKLRYQEKIAVCGFDPYAWLAQLVERQSAVREVEGSSPRPDQHSGS